MALIIEKYLKKDNDSNIKKKKSFLYIMLVYLILFIYITMYLHFDCQCLSTNSWTYFLDEAVIARALPRMMATEIC